MEVTMDKFGRIVIPKRVRDDLHLRPGAALSLERRESEIVLQPREEEPLLVRKDGFLVYMGKPTGDLRSVVEEDRRQRDRQNLRWGKD